MNNRFLEQYKRADNICRDIYENDSGVTNYINLMRDAKDYKDGEIDGWDATLKTLLRLRSVRNKLTHEVGTLDMELCNGDDVLWLEEFCDSLLAATDPLAEHYRTFNKKKTKKNAKSHPIPDQSAFESKKAETGLATASVRKNTEPVFKTTSTYKRKKRVPIAFKIIGFFTLVILALYLLMELYKLTL